jgi:hypothetical protein
VSHPFTVTQYEGDQLVSIEAATEDQIIGMHLQDLRKRIEADWVTYANKLGLSRPAIVKEGRSLIFRVKVFLWFEVSILKLGLENWGAVLNLEPLDKRFGEEGPLEFGQELSNLIREEILVYGFEKAGPGMVIVNTRFVTPQ